MPPNQRKSYYPDSSTPYTLYVTKPKVDPPMALVKEATATEEEFQPRPTYLKVGILSQVKGSAYMEYGNTKVIAAILPPREITKQTRKGTLGIISCELKYAQFASRSQNIIKREKTLSAALKKAMEPVICRHEFPNFQIDIMVYVLQDDGCALSTAINCCGAALAEGGIPVYDVITSSTVSIMNGKILSNPTATDEDSLSTFVSPDESCEQGTVTIATLSSVNQIAECYQNGYISYPTLETLISKAVTINTDMLNTVKHVLVTKMQRHIKNDAK